MTEKERQIREVLGDDFPLLPEILNALKPPIEIGKYYRYQEIIFKAIEVEENSKVWGYGLIDGEAYEEYGYFADLDDYRHLEEITQKEFLNCIAKYTVDVLGFKEGVEYIDTRGDQGGVIHEPIQYKDEDSLHCGKGQGLIFEDGKFAEVVEKPEEVPVSPIWEPTTYLGYKRYNGSPVLQQKWVETNTGAEEWRKVGMV